MTLILIWVSRVLFDLVLQEYKARVGCVEMKFLLLKHFDITYIQRVRFD